MYDKYLLDYTLRQFPAIVAATVNADGSDSLAEAENRHASMD